ncbi:hypothetical protein MBLNU13_g00150t1 [Cladosporium sp. NU13]
MPPKEKYTDPKLRDEVKEEIHNGDKGGAPGQWSARKAQMMAAEYKKRGGDYNTDKSEQDESQKHLSEWTEEEWQTKEGSGNAKQDDGTEKRYLPKKAWEQMSEKEKEQTEEKKLEGSKEGKQHVDNTKKAKESRKKASKDKNGGDDEEDEEEEEDAENDGEEEYQDDGADEEEVEGDDDEEDQEDGEEAKADGKKRTRGQQNGSNKSQKDNSGKAQSKSNGSKNSSNGQSKEETDDTDNKDSGNKSSNNGNKKGTVGSKHMPDEDPAPKGSADRLPKKGQAAQWKALPGFVKGTVEDILTEEQEVNGKNVKASEKDPRIVLKSDSSGKICVHKPEACYYE